MDSSAHLQVHATEATGPVLKWAGVGRLLQFLHTTAETLAIKTYLATVGDDLVLRLVNRNRLTVRIAGRAFTARYPDHHGRRSPTRPALAATRAGARPL